MKRLDIVNGPENILRKKKADFSSGLQGAFLRGVIVEKQFDEIVKAFGEAGIGFAPMKGILFRRILYDDPYERDLTDLDLLIKREDFDRAGKSLSSLGYSLKDDFHDRIRFGAIKERVYSRAGALPVEIHFSVSSGRGAARLSELIFEDASAGGAPFHEAHVIIPSPEQNLVAMAFHFREHGLRLEGYQFNDIGRFVERLEPDIHKADALAAETGCRLGLSLLLDAARIKARIALNPEQGARRKFLSAMLRRSENGVRLGLPGNRNHRIEPWWHLALHLYLLRDSLLESALSQADHIAYLAKTLARSLIGAETRGK